ncbi:MAG: lactate utilization protein [Tepidisphaeraceae bacterium]|jgi:L-lactate utilization protein LutC
MPDPMIEKVRKALGRSRPLENPPTPPQIPDSIARLAAKDADLVDLFAKSAVGAKFLFEQVPADQIRSRLIEFLRLHQCAKIGIPASPLLDRLQIQKSLEDAGLSVHRWNVSTLDAAYELDCGLTDVYAAVAETGSLVIRSNPNHGSAISLVPPIHVALVEPATIVPDLIDLLEKIRLEPRPPNVTVITGPSKTADIEGALVTGVHGPGLVQVFLVRAVDSG